MGRVVGKSLAGLNLGSEHKVQVRVKTCFCHYIAILMSQTMQTDNYVWY